MADDVKDEESNIVTFTDDDGKEVDFEFLDVIEYEGGQYAVLLPANETEANADELVILQIVPDPENDEMEQYIGVEDMDTLTAIFNIFRESHADEFDFAD